MANYRQIVEIELPDGSTALAEISGAPRSGDASRARPRFRLEDAGAQVSGLVSSVLGSVRDALPDAPDEIGVEFGLKLTVASGAIVSILTEATGEASLVVRATWRKDQHP